MAKRFTDTEKWKDDWYLSLSNDYKIVWQWLLDNCSHAGICKPSLNLLNRICQTNITQSEFENVFGSRVLSNGNVWFIPKFIKFQYPTLHSKKPAIISVVKEIIKNNLCEMIPISFGNDYLIIKDKDKDKDNNTYSIDTIENNKNGVEVFSPLLDQFGFIDPKEAEMRYLNAEQYKSSLDEMAMIHHTSVSNVTAWVKKFTSKLIIEGWKNAMTEWIRYFSNWMNKNYSPGEINPSTISSETKAEKYQRLIRENKELLKNARPNS